MESDDPNLKINALVAVVKGGVRLALVSRIHRSADGFPLIAVKNDTGEEETIAPVEIFFLVQTDGTLKTPSAAIQKLDGPVLIRLVEQIANYQREEGIAMPAVQKGSLVILPDGASERVKGDRIGLVARISPNNDKADVRISWKGSVLVDPGKLVHIIDTDGKSMWPARAFRKYLPQIIVTIIVKQAVLEMIQMGKRLGLNPKDLHVLLPICFPRP